MTRIRRQGRLFDRVYVPSELVAGMDRSRQLPIHGRAVDAKLPGAQNRRFDDSEDHVGETILLARSSLQSTQRRMYRGLVIRGL